MAQPERGSLLLSGTCVVTPETKAAVSSGRQSSHRVTRRCPQEGTLRCGRQLGAGGLEPVRDTGWGAAELQGG